MSTYDDAAQWAEDDMTLPENSTTALRGKEAADYGKAVIAQSSDEDSDRFESVPGKCPDKGACHHHCEVSCFRVNYAEPLSGVYTGNRWPEVVRSSHTLRAYHLNLTGGQIGYLEVMLRQEGWHQAADSLAHQHRVHLEIESWDEGD
jgi:hypothetical protein